MPNLVALILGLVLVAAAIADQALNGGEAGLYLMRKLLDAVDYLSFWR